MLQLNIRSLLGKQNELNLMLNELHKRKSLPKILLLSETQSKDTQICHITILYVITEQTSKVGSYINSQDFNI